MPFAWRINITKNPKKGQPAIFSFEETPQVQIGDLIFWSNNDKVAHWPGLADDPKAFIPTRIAKNSTSQAFAPGTVGTITYICTLHEGESGVIQVAAAAPPPAAPANDDK